MKKINLEDDFTYSMVYSIVGIIMVGLAWGVLMLTIFLIRKFL